MGYARSSRIQSGPFLSAGGKSHDVLLTRDERRARRGILLQGGLLPAPLCLGGQLALGWQRKPRAGLRALYARRSSGHSAEGKVLRATGSSPSGFPGTRIGGRSSCGTGAVNDCTFSAPKSVSIAYVAGVTGVKEAHDEAFLSVLSHVEDHYSHYRSPSGVMSRGMVATKFDHATSRIIAPQFHSTVWPTSRFGIANPASQFALQRQNREPSMI